jgi:hypothetical protein
MARARRWQGRGSEKVWWGLGRESEFLCFLQQLITPTRC